MPFDVPYAPEYKIVKDIQKGETFYHCENLAVDVERGYLERMFEDMPADMRSKFELVTGNVLALQLKTSERTTSGGGLIKSSLRFYQKKAFFYDVRREDLSAFQDLLFFIQHYEQELSFRDTVKWIAFVVRDTVNRLPW